MFEWKITKKKLRIVRKSKLSFTTEKKALSNNLQFKSFQFISINEGERDEVSFVFNYDKNEIMKSNFSSLILIILPPEASHNCRVRRRAKKNWKERKLISDFLSLSPLACRQSLVLNAILSIEQGVEGKRDLLASRFRFLLFTSSKKNSKASNWINRKRATVRISWTAEGHTHKSKKKHRLCVWKMTE